MSCLRIFLKNVRDFILRFDLFAAAPTLRVRGQSSYQSLGCGIISLVLIGVFIGIFAQEIINVLNKQGVTALVNLDDQPQSTQIIDAIHFAIGIEKKTFDEINGYFQFSLETLTMGAGMSQLSRIQLIKCTQQIWNGYSPDIGSYYDPMHVMDMFCIPPTANTTLYGYEGSVNSNILQLTVSKCVSFQPNETQCQPNENIDQMFRSVGYIPVRLLFVNKIISPSNEIPVTTTIQKNIYMSFSGNLGMRGEIVLGKYLVQTDESILPFEQIQTQTGHYIQSFRTYTVGIQPTGADFDPLGTRNNNYIQIQIRKSTLIYYVQRVHQKIDDLLSYIGGLFSLIFVVIFFFFGSFNEYRMELMVAQSSFSYGGDGKKIREKDLGFLTYVLYSFYDWLKMVGINLRWEKMQKIDEAREQANQQLDMTYLMRKIRYYDWCISLLMEKSHKVTSHLRKPVTIQQSIKDRKLLNYYDKVIKNRFSDRQLQRAYQIFQLNSKTGSKKLPIQQYRSRKTLQEEEPPKNDQDAYNEKSTSIFGGIVNSLGEEKKPVKKERKCPKCCSCRDLIEDEYDSDDEEAERMLYQEYGNLANDNSEAAIKIKQRIPLYLKTRLYAKLKSEGVSMQMISENNINNNNVGNGFISLDIE